MSIKSDLWIRRMAESDRMIEPFEHGQVRLAVPATSRFSPISIPPSSIPSASTKIVLSISVETFASFHRTLSRWLARLSISVFPVMS